MPCLTDAERGRALGMLEARRSQAEVSRLFRCSKQTIRNLQRRFLETGSWKDCPRSGQPRVTTIRQDRHIRISHLQDCFRPATRTAALTIGTHGCPVSGHTVRRRLKEATLTCRRPFKGPILTPANWENREAWARQRQRRTLQQWGTVVLSDESRFCLGRESNPGY
jgi:transposase